MPGQLPPSETHADGDIEAVGVLVAFMAVRCSDVDGRGQGNGNVHCNNRPRPTTNTKRHGRETLGIKKSSEEE